MLLSIILHTAKFGLRDAIVALLWNLTNSSESQSAPMLLGGRNRRQFNVVLAGENSPGTTNYSSFLSCMINLFVSKPRRRADRVAHRKLSIELVDKVTRREI